MFENFEFAPLPGSMMAISVLGFMLTVVYKDSLELTWTFTLGLFFLILFMASFLSLHYGPLPERELRRL